MKDKHKITSFIYKQISTFRNNVLIDNKYSELLAEEINSDYNRRSDIDNLIDIELNNMSSQLEILTENEAGFILVSKVCKDIYSKYENQFKFKTFWREEIENKIFELIFDIELKNSSDFFQNSNNHELKIVWNR